VNVLPCPAPLTSRISPPSSIASSRLIARPRPVPPYLRLVPASACWNASKISFCFSGAMPMPVSVTLKATACGAMPSTGWSGVQPDSTWRIVIGHLPLRRELEGVREQVLEDLLQAFGV
jgi:hypothetical protein